jgi:DNA-binding Lrp family transcriptional regulator
MDDTDLGICHHLFNNSRMPQRDLADILGITVAQVHRRIDTMIDEGVIREFTANISRGYLGAVSVQVDGVCDCKSVGDLATRMEENDSVQSLLTYSANLTTATLLLRDIADLGPAVEFVRQTLQMREPKVTISAQIYVGDVPSERQYTGARELSRLDYRIIRALHHNARKPVVDIAEETGITAKTVRLHLEQMEREGAIEYTMLWNPIHSAGANFVIRVDLRPGTDKGAFISSMNRRFGARIILTFVHSNMLDYVCGYCWAPTVAQHQALVDTLEADETVIDVKSSIVHQEWKFETWRDKLLHERAGTGRAAPRDLDDD